VLLGAGDGNRTHTTSLEGWDSTVELHPPTPADCKCALLQQIILKDNPKFHITCKNDTFMTTAPTIPYMESLFALQKYGAYSPQPPIKHPPATTKNAPFLLIRSQNMHIFETDKTSFLYLI
jgi:hypothetical protein